MLDFGDDAVLFDAEQTRAQVNSPAYLGAVWGRDKTVLVDPARLAWGLAEACRSLGVRIHENSYVRSLDREGDVMVLRTGHGVVHADRVALGTNAFPSLLRRVRPYVIPVYDYAMATEPLSAAQLAAIGWSNRQGVGDSGNQFHYYRLTDDNCILWGGYDAIYHYGSRIDPDLDQRPETFQTAGRALLRTPFRSSKACGSPTPGAASSTPARGSSRSSVPGTADGSPTPPATPASASGQPGSEPRSCSTCCPGSAPS